MSTTAPAPASLVVTGATGHLGRLAVEALLARGVDPSSVTAAGRNPERLAELAALGVRTAAIDFTDPQSLAAAFAGADRVLLVSGSEVGQRAAQHQNAIDAAEAAGVGLVAYTSAPYADTTKLLLAAEHLATEQALAASGVAHIVLRNSWYIENYTDQLDATLAHGVVLGSAGDGRVSGATRADFAAAAAAVLATDGHEGRVYELGGDDAFTLTELAAAISRSTGQAIAYQDVPPAALLDVLTGAGVPTPFAEILVDADRAIAAGELRTDSGDLRRLIGRPTTPLADAVAARS